MFTEDNDDDVDIEDADDDLGADDFEKQWFLNTFISKRKMTLGRPFGDWFFFVEILYDIYLKKFKIKGYILQHSWIKGIFVRKFACFSFIKSLRSKLQSRDRGLNYLKLFSACPAFRKLFTN